MVTTKDTGPHSYDARLKYAVNELGQDVLGKRFNLNFKPPRKYTGMHNLLVLFFC